MVDKGEFAKRAIEISPTLNGGYFVAPVAAVYEVTGPSVGIAFSNYTDLLNWIVEEYRVANLQEEASPSDSAPTHPSDTQQERETK